MIALKVNVLSCVFPECDNRCKAKAWCNICSSCCTLQLFTMRSGRGVLHQISNRVQNVIKNLTQSDLVKIKMRGQKILHQ